MAVVIKKYTKDFGKFGFVYSKYSVSRGFKTWVSNDGISFGIFLILGKIGMAIGTKKVNKEDMKS